MDSPPFAVAPGAQAVLERLWSAGQAAYVVGGAVRDALLGRETHDWDVATDARPEAILGLFPDGQYENRFGTVLARGVEITTFRRDHAYPDHRRPASITFTDDVTEDLLRRDFTVNAIAWGRSAGPVADAGYVDPSGGRADLEARLLRAVGDPDRRFDEDALRLLRAARIAAAVGLDIEPATLAAMRRHAADVRWVSGERVGIELRRMVEAETPSGAFRILDRAGLLETTLPELAAPPSRGLDHALATLDLIAHEHPGRERLVLAALVHDVADEASRVLLARVAWPAREARAARRIVEAGRSVVPDALSDAEVRRFIRFAGVDLVDEVLILRAACATVDGDAPEAAAFARLGARVAQQRAAGVPLSLADLAVDGSDLIATIGRAPGPWVGDLLDRLLDRVLDDPAANTRAILLALAEAWLAADVDGGRP